MEEKAHTPLASLACTPLGYIAFVGHILGVGVDSLGVGRVLVVALVVVVEL